jgi:hypothetical protein
MSVYGQDETLEFFNNDKILIVNNYTSLNLCFTNMLQQTSLGVDLEGRLRAIGGNINLIQIGCAEGIVYIFDMYHI